MKPLLALALLSLPCAADTITFRQRLDLAPTVASANHLEFADAFTVPQFNPVLGTLNSVIFSVEISGGLAWEQLFIEPIHSPFYDFHVKTRVSTLGVDVTHSEGPVFGGYGYTKPCNVPQNPLPCGPAWSQISDNGGVTLVGTIGEGASQFGVGLLGGGSSFFPLTGSLPTSLDPYIGASSFSLPARFVIDASPSASQYHIGGLLPNQDDVFSDLYWAYNYTPVQSIQGVTHAPEPAITWLLVAGVCLVAVRRTHQRCA